MDSFDDQHILLEELYEDSFYPDFLIDKIKYLLEDFINFVEQKSKKLWQMLVIKFYDLNFKIANSLQYEFLDNDSEYDNIARECLIRNLEYIIQWFHLPINLEEALAEREWD